MTEKLLTFPSPTPLSYLPRPWGWGLKVEIQLFFPVQHQHNPTLPKIFVPGHHVRIQEFFVRGVCVCVCGGGGGGSRLLNLFYSLKRGPMVLLHIFQGGGEGSNFFQGWGSNRTHITITCDFPGGLDPLSPLCIRT